MVLALINFLVSHQYLFGAVPTVVEWYSILITMVEGIAYIDPGSGSAIMSVIIGLFVAIGITIKTYWYKLKSIFTRNKKETKKKP